VARPRSVLRWFQLYGWTAYGVSTYLSVLPALGAGQWLPLIWIKVLRTCLGFGASLVLIRLYRRIAGRSLGVHTVVVIVASSVLGAVWVVTFLLAVALIRGKSLSTVPWPTLPRESIDYTFVLLAWSGAYLALRLWRAASRAANRVTELELEALRYQLNPHFLVNALISIRASIPADALPARAMISELSRFLRHALESSPTALTPLGQEIAALDSYLAIERRRFQGQLDIDVRVDPSAEQLMVPGLLLHPLVENAIKHGLPGRRTDQPMALRVVAAEEAGAIAIEVANTGVLGPRVSAVVGLGIGLRNVRERLERVFPDRASLDLRQDGAWVRVRIEIRRADA
jgi:hypothetical protein